MLFSNIALKVLAAKEVGLIKSNAQFYSNFPDQDTFEIAIAQNDELNRSLDALTQQYSEYDVDEGFVCRFDDNFPVINSNVKNSEKPYLLFYKGNIDLLSDLNKNVAVIGLIDPTLQITQREIEVVTELIRCDLTIVSGLAKGCDTTAHIVCVDTGKKTIAILPSQISKITPAANRGLAKDIVLGGGLLLTEYYKEPASRNDAVGRFIERDRLQAMFSKAVVLIASYRKNEGDSGSRHAMEAARNYAIERYVMYNQETDIDDRQFGLNKDLIQPPYGAVKILNKKSVDTIKTLSNPNLSCDVKYTNPEQLKLF